MKKRQGTVGNRCFLSAPGPKIYRACCTYGILFSGCAKTDGRIKRGCKKHRVFYSPSKKAGGDSGFFDGISVGFALHFVEISVDAAAK
ncbi:MAG TPA: hypothetical protein DEV98_06755 [Clostridiales bacterium]|nr:hypothetical protein [Clostridiales bacterium]